jgi:hypothetical protein
MIVIIQMSVEINPLFGQVNHSYPRIFTFHFGNATPEWYARFDLVVTGQDYTEIKKINPNALTFARRDWNVWEISATAPEEWFVRDTQGNKVESGYGYLLDMSNYCSKSSAYGGKQYNEYLIDITLEMVNSPNYDGFFCQGVWDHPYGTTNVDLDKNGVNDWDEHGKDWLKSVWLEGLHKTASALMPKMKAINKVLILNSGRFHDFEWANSNGLMLEHDHAPFNFSYFKNMYDKWMGTAPQPHLLVLDTEAESKNAFSDMRYILTTVLLGDGYFSFTDKGSEEHAYKKYYDEFDLDLGFPTSNALSLSNGCWIRFFDKGVSITNPTGSNQTVTDNNLRSFSQYAGPYNKFEGGQDHNFNDGSQFSQVSLSSSESEWGTYGDGIILLKGYKAVVSDIILDDVDAGTSPNSVPAKFSGSWVYDDDTGDGFYFVAFKTWKNLFKYAYSQKGSGENSAVYTPTIGVDGNYEVFEWHGWMGSSPDNVKEATNVPYTIIYTGNKTSSGTINQSINYSKWNSLGTFYFDKGTNGNIKITNNANGSVIADAFKLVYKGRENDTVLPNAPSDLKCESKTEISLKISWSAPQVASDGDLASSYQINRNSVLIGEVNSTNYLDTGLSENQTYSYAIYAVDNVGNKSSSAATGSFTTIADVIPPAIVSATATGFNTVEVLFSEPVEKNSAEGVNNYQINNNITISSALLLSDLKTVSLTTTDHKAGVTYQVTINNIKDRAVLSNTISSNSSATYVGINPPMTITMAVDDGYDLYVNGNLVGSGNEWKLSQKYTIPFVPGKNVIALKCYDQGEKAGLIAEIDYNGKHYVSDENWKVTKSEQTNWQTVNFDDSGWQKASAYGAHGSALPWSQYQNITGIAINSNVQWIWSADNLNDDLVFMRFTIKSDGDMMPPNPPVGIIIKGQ